MPAGSPAGVVYTRQWVADTILDLAGLDPTADIVGSGTVVEPACGDGAFLTSIVDRVVTSARTFGHSDTALNDAVAGFDVDPIAVDASRANAATSLRGHGYTSHAAERIAARWIRRADFLTSTDSVGPAGWVLGNPPYVRIERADPRLLETYRSRWKTMTGRADLYIGFIEAGLSMLRPGGRLAYICPDRWMFNAYGKALRAFITEGYDLESVVTMHDVDAFAARVNAYPATVVIRRGSQSRPFVAEAHTGFDASSARQLLRTARSPDQATDRTETADRYDFRRPHRWPPPGDRGWTFPIGADHDMVDKLQETFPTLEQAGVTVRVGIATGADDVFVVGEDHDIEPDRLEPVVSANETRTGSIAWRHRHVVNPWGDLGLVDLDRYPGLAAYLYSHGARLRQRRVARDHPTRWWRTIDRIDSRLTSTPKLLIPDVKHTVDPVLDPGGFQPMHNLYYLLAPDWDLEVLGGLLMSEPASSFVRAYSVRMANGYMRVTAQYLRRIRIPAADSIGADTARDLALAFRDRDADAVNRAASRAYGV